MSRLLGLALAIGAVILTPGCREAGPAASARAPERSSPSAIATAEPAASREIAGAEPAAPPARRALPLTGIPAMTYRARSPRDDHGEPRIPYEDLRLGLYDPEARRFVPVTPPVPSALGGLVDASAGRALVLAGDLVMGEIWLVQARRVDVSLFDLREPGRVVLQVDDVDTRHPQTNEIRVAVQAALAGDDAVRVTLRDLGYDPKGTASVLVTTAGVRLTPEHVGHDQPRVHVDASSAWVGVPPPEGLTLEGNRLHVQGRVIELGRGHEPGHQHVARTADGRFVMIFSEQAGCREVAFVRHVLDRVELDTGAVTRLSAAPVHAGAALGPDGSVYLDADGRVLRFPPDSITAVADVLPGMRWATPGFDRDCSI